MTIDDNRSSNHRNDEDAHMSDIERNVKQHDHMFEDEADMNQTYIVYKMIGIFFKNLQ